MFTGIIGALGRVQTVKESKNGVFLELGVPKMTFVQGESIAINGCCLTAKDSGECFKADVSFESLAKTNLGRLKRGSIVNVEAALKLGDRLGGHWVSGHVDKTVTIGSFIEKGDFFELILKGFSHTDQNFLLPKGSITVDGISLTINEVEKGTCQCVIIPHTHQATNLHKREAGDRVNIEFDYLARVIHHQRLVELNKVLTVE